MRRKLIILFAIVLIVSVGFFVVKNNLTDKKDYNLFGSGNENGDNENEPTGAVISEPLNSGNERNAEDSASGQEESTDGQSSGTECYEGQISYSITNFNVTSICNAYDEEICLDKTVICSIEIHNMDDDISGFFEIKLLFVEEGGNLENPIDEKTSRFFLEPQDYNLFEDSINIQSSGQGGLANKEITCFYSTLEVPKKSFC